MVTVQQQRKSWLVYPSIVVLVVLATTLIVVTDFIEDRLEESGETQVVSYTEQMASFMGESVNMIETAIGSFSVDWPDSPSLSASLRLFRDRFGFTKVAFANMDGTGVTADGEPFSISELSLEETALALGRDGYGYSETYVNEDGEYVRLAQRPVFIDDEQVGALYVQVPLSLFMPAYYDEDDYGSDDSRENEAYLFDGGTGEVLVGSSRGLGLLVEGESVYDFVEQSLAGQVGGSSLVSSGATSMSRVRMAVAEGESVLVVGNVDGASSYICLAPTGKGSWYVANIVSVGSVRAEAQFVKVVFSVVFFLSAACIVLAVGVAVFLYRRQEREREMEAKKHLYDALSVSLEMAEAANRAKTSFLSRMSHEIRTPMNVIIGMLKITRKNVGNPELLRENLDHIEHASEHLLDLINEVLDISKIESGKAVFNDEPFCLSEVIESLCEVIEPQCAERGLSFEVEKDGPVDAVFLGDKVRIRQMLVNLLTNAVKYNREGGWVVLRVSVEPSLAAGYQRLTFVVADGGIGMAPEFLERVFEPFAMEERSRSEGTGLGMSIVRTIVSAMGGDVHIESELDRGTTVTVVVNKKMLADDPRDTTPVSAPSLEGVRVLLVEDSELNAEIARELLSDEGLEVEWAQDGVIACEMFAASMPFNYDAILMDVRMPNMDGLEATRAIRAMPRGDAARVPIIAMSANAFADDVLASLKAGMNAHLSKPIDIDELMRAIADALRSEEGQE